MFAEGPKGLRGKDCPKVFDFLNFRTSGDNRRILASSLIFTPGGTLCLCCVRSGELEVRLSSEQLLVLVGSVALCFMNWLVGTWYAPLLPFGMGICFAPLGNVDRAVLKPSLPGSTWTLSLGPYGVLFGSSILRIMTSSSVQMGHLSPVCVTSGLNALAFLGLAHNDSAKRKEE